MTSIFLLFFFRPWKLPRNHTNIFKKGDYATPKLPKLQIADSVCEWKPDNYPRTGNFLNWLSWSWTEVGGGEAGVTEKVKLQVANYGTWWLFFCSHTYTNQNKRCAALISACEWMWEHLNASQRYLSSRFWPTHTRPPWRGVGLLQERWRTWKPMPQLVLQGDQEVQGVHAPFLCRSVEKSRFKMVVKSVKILHLTINHLIGCAVVLQWRFWDVFVDGESSPRQAVTIPWFWQLSHGIFLDLRV